MNEYLAWQWIKCRLEIPFNTYIWWNQKTSSWEYKNNNFTIPGMYIAIPVIY